MSKQRKKRDRQKPSRQAELRAQRKAKLAVEADRARGVVRAFDRLERGGMDRAR